MKNNKIKEYLAFFIIIGLTSFSSLYFSNLLFSKLYDNTLNDFKIFLYSFLIFLFVTTCLSIITYNLLEIYNKKKITEALAPAYKLSTLINEIIKGESSVDDIDNIYDELVPYLKKSEDWERYNLNKALKNLLDSESNRREFTANVTHELKTPLTSINGYAEMIASGLASNEDIKKFALIINEEGNRLLDLINDMIELSRLDYDSKNLLNLEKIDLEKLVLEEVSKYEAFAQSKNIEIKTLTTSSIIDIDVKMIREVIDNLLSNAINYNHENGSVLIRIIDFEDRSKIIVEDNGIGISEKDQQRIFERFYIVNRNNNLSTGLGLSMVKHIIQKHKGNINLVSKLGIGSTFTITLYKNIKEILEQ